jgi:hypothetical protein
LKIFHWPVLQDHTTRQRQFSPAVPNARIPCCDAQKLRLALRPLTPTFVLRLNDPGGRPLDLVQRINVLAICAAFVFVGAILLGMF